MELLRNFSCNRFIKKIYVTTNVPVVPQMSMIGLNTDCFKDLFLKGYTNAKRIKRLIVPVKPK